MEFHKCLCSFQEGISRLLLIFIFLIIWKDIIKEQTQIPSRDPKAGTICDDSLWEIWQHPEDFSLFKCGYRTKWTSKSFLPFHYGVGYKFPANESCMWQIGFILSFPRNVTIYLNFGTSYTLPLCWQVHPIKKNPSVLSSHPRERSQFNKPIYDIEALRGFFIEFLIRF